MATNDSSLVRLGNASTAMARKRSTDRKLLSRRKRPVHSHKLPPDKNASRPAPESSLPIPINDGFPSYLSTPSAKPNPNTIRSGMKKYLLNGRFKLMKWLGSGGMAEVYLAHDFHLGRKVAIKMIRDGVGEMEIMRRFFTTEMRVLRRMNHPGVPEFICAGDFHGRQFYAMEAVFGLSLDKKLKLQREWIAENALLLFSMVCRILEEVHKQRIIHRDIKPGNIIVPDISVYHASVKLVDFGLAKVSNYSVSKDSAIGTYCYLPPERYHSKMDDFYGDIYSLGLTMYAILGGFRIVNTPMPWYLRMAERLPELRGVHPEMNAIIAKAAEIDPEKRWDSAYQMGLAIDRFKYEYGNLGWKLP